MASPPPSSDHQALFCCLPLPGSLAKMLQGIFSAVSGNNPHGTVSAKLKGSVVLMKKNVLDFNDYNASILDNLHELLGHGVSFQLVSATAGDPSHNGRGRVGKVANLEEWVTTLTSVAAGESRFNLSFELEEGFGVPGAVVVKNHHHSEFFLKSLAVEGVPGKGKVHFDCNSWVYPADKYKYDRVFFANDTYLPNQTPEPLRLYRAEELHHLRGDDVSGQLQEHDRVYGYAYYNDLGNPDKGADLARPVLGGSKEHPYPRRGRTGRRPSRTDPKTESRLPLLSSLNVYVPRDERFGHLKMSDFLTYALKSVAQSLLPALEALFDKTPLEFDTLQDVLNLYEGGIPLPDSPALHEIRDRIPFEMIKELVTTDGAELLKMPLPEVLKEDKTAWMTDEEFGREMLAGVNPVDVRRLEEFPPTSKLDPKVYGDHTSSITTSHIEKNLDGLTVQEALSTNKLFILDHHDTLIPYLNRINSTSNKIYASRTLLFLTANGTLRPLAIELSLPHPDGEQHGAVNKVFTPADHGVEHSIWQLAKAYASVDDSGVHQLVSHWLNTHAVIEPFVIATNRQLSIVHPIHKLLRPHYRDTMNINAFARQILINGGGILEKTVFPDKYAMEMSSFVYKDWKFTEQGLPDDLLKRGVAVRDPTNPGKLQLLINDYPYAVDGLAVWSAIESWVGEYCTIYYPDESVLRNDTELQAWWKEIREVGHGDKKDETWWPEMQTVSELSKICTTIIWISSALHAAVNFGQYPYAGFMPNRPTMSRRFMPEPGTEEYDEVRRTPEKAYMKTITSQLQAILGVALIEILSRHSSDEVYLGQRDTAEWTSDERALTAFRRFGEHLVKIEKQIGEMNRDEGLKNRTGPVKMPYLFLYPNTSDNGGVGGLGTKGIPNSVSI